jgi:hypothetical protein
MTLQEFLVDCPHAILWYTSTWRPTGETEFVWSGVVSNISENDSWQDITGTVTDGAWEWDGSGNPTDYRQNSVLRISAYSDQEQWESLKADYDAECSTPAVYTYHEEGGHSEEIEAESMDEAIESAQDMAEGGEWGDEGASIMVWVTKEVDGEEVERKWLTVEIDPNHDALIRAAVRKAGLEAWAVCGTDPDCHDWTGEGHGGSDENPGVWQTGGTGLAITEHCRNCGLHRERHIVGSQHNPGEHDTVVYTMPEEWDAEDDE